MNQNLREPITHGSAEYPFALYHIRASLHAFNVSLHWHDEVEIIYIKKGNLHLIIDKDSYLGTAGDIFIVNSQEIHEMSAAACALESRRSASAFSPDGLSAVFLPFPGEESRVFPLDRKHCRKPGRRRIRMGYSRP